MNKRASAEVTAVYMRTINRLAKTMTGACEAQDFLLFMQASTAMGSLCVFENIDTIMMAMFGPINIMKATMLPFDPDSSPVVSGIMDSYAEDISAIAERMKAERA